METAYRVLVVEDDVELGTAIAEQLGCAGGFAVEAVTTIQAAEKAISAPASDVSAILLDVRLPDGARPGPVCPAAPERRQPAGDHGQRVGP